MQQTIPFTAWEQAVFVTLFVFFVIALLSWVARENKANRDFQRIEAASREKAQAERDAQWRDFLETQRETDQQMSKAVKESMDGLTSIISHLVDEVQGNRADFKEHDAMEKAKLEEMSKKIHEPKTRRKAGGFE
jgi:hypothetical protein